MAERDDTTRSLTIIQSFIEARFGQLDGQIKQVQKEVTHLHSAMYDQKDGIVYRVKGLESSIKMLCGVLRWTGGIAGVLLAAFLLFFFSEMYKAWHAYDSLRPLIEQSEKLKK